MACAGATYKIDLLLQGFGGEPENSSGDGIDLGLGELS